VFPKATEVGFNCLSDPQAYYVVPRKLNWVSRGFPS
jgi:hypothetical protein